MISRLLQKRNGKYYCSECRIEQFEIKEQCSFCGSTFSNYEEILVKLFELENKNDKTV